MVEDINVVNINTGESLPLSMLTTPFYILQSVDWGSISVNRQTYRFVNQIGASIASSYLGTRPINIIGWVVANSDFEMAFRKDFLNRFFNPLHSFKCEYKQYIIDFVLDNTIKYSTNTKENNEVMCKFEINGICPDPRFRNNEETREEIATYIPKFHFPLVISETPNPPGGIIFGERTEGKIATVINQGSVSTGFRIEFKAIGTVSNPYLQDVNSREFFKINKTLSANESITVNTEIGSKRVIGRLNGEDSNYFKYKSVDSDWLQLSIGENYFTYGATSGVDNLIVILYHTDKWLEVQQ